MSFLDDLAREIYEISERNGFTHEGRNLGEMLALAHSELSECLEEDRNGKPGLYYEDESDLSSKPEGMWVELADCIIRCLDTMLTLGCASPEAVIRLKMEYNKTRPWRHGGRSY